MKEEYIYKIYAGWLAKIIGIRYGAPVEGWTYDKIRNIYGEINNYVADYNEFAADDDSNGPIFFLRALEDSGNGINMTAMDVGKALLNYAPFEHGFFWWGGYGVSTEHTAYLNLRNGIPAPRSGSMVQNGATIAEQIGGQIFIDTWGLVSPGNPDQAAKFATEAASVTHDGNGVYGGIFVASCIAYAFDETDIRKIIGKGLSYIPKNCEYANAVNAVIKYHDEYPDDWKRCLAYIQENWGYLKYPGNCHIIPNISCMILALMYGNGDFTKTLSICNMCGWDTDCNVGNVGTIMGVRNGLDDIDYNKWRKPINDFLACSSVIGSLNIMDIPYGALYITKMAYEISGDKVPEQWKGLIDERINSCHFEFPGSTHAIHVRVDTFRSNSEPSNKTVSISNTDEVAHTGKRSLKFSASQVAAADNIYVYKKTYYLPDNFHDSRYDPSFSPMVYPGQTIHGSAMIPSYGYEAKACLYIRDVYSKEIYHGNFENLNKGFWKELSYRIPILEDLIVGEIGFIVCPCGVHTESFDFVGMIDDLYVDGVPEYQIKCCNLHEEIWNNLHKEISQFTRLKGLVYLADGQMHLSCSDFGEVYTGSYDWKDYKVRFLFTPIIGDNHRLNVRVQGAIRSYAFALLPEHRAAILKNDNGYHVLKEIEFDWELEKEYAVQISVESNTIIAMVDDVSLSVTDNDHPYMHGCIGASVCGGSHDSLRTIGINFCN
jgi:ADP-ribosylglycohydrolase